MIDSLRPYSIDEVAELIGRSVTTVRRLIAAGELRTLGGDRGRVVHRSVDAWLEHQRRARALALLAASSTRRERPAQMLDCELRAESVRGSETTPGVCWLCGVELPKRRQRWCSQACLSTWLRNHYWNYARAQRKRLDERACVRCDAADRLEVNHIVPLVGSGYDEGCVHHLDGLETLCHPCHVVETTRQRRERRVERLGYDPERAPAPGVELLRMWPE